MSEHPHTVGRPRWLVFVALCCLGCARLEPLGERTSPVDDGGTAELRVVDRGEFESVLAEQQGKVVLVDFWATWCAPCVKQLPHTFELASELQSKGLAVITVCMEDPDDAQRIQEFLASRNGSEAINLISSEGGSPQVMDVFDITGGALPYYKLYDRQSQLRHTFAIDPSAAEQFTPGDIESAVNAMLEE